MADEATSGLTPELFQLALRLERIFMPQARKQRIQAGFDDEHVQTPIRFVHYTSAEAALKIIRSKRMWMRNTTCMTDYREVQHGLKIIETHSCLTDLKLIHLSRPLMCARRALRVKPF